MNEDLLDGIDVGNARMVDVAVCEDEVLIFDTDSGEVVFRATIH